MKKDTSGVAAGTESPIPKKTGRRSKRYVPSTGTARIGVENQPVNSVVWVPRDQLRGNGYNPNHVAPPELELLKISILEDGWTQPIVARQPEGGFSEVVDGFHRWTVSADPDVYAMTDGLVPVVYLPADLDAAQQRMATIRHNRARGIHGVVKMADIVAELANGLGVSPEEISRRLQMDEEEVTRLRDRGDMLKRHGDGEFGTGWTIDGGFGDDQAV